VVRSLCREIVIKALWRLKDEIQLTSIAVQENLHLKEVFRDVFARLSQQGGTKTVSDHPIT